MAETISSPAQDRPRGLDSAASSGGTSWRRTCCSCPRWPASPEYRSGRWPRSSTYSFQNYGLPQLTGAEPTQWVGFSNFTQTFTDPEFWLSLRITVLFAVVAVPLTLIVGTLVGLLLNRLGRKMAAFVSTSALLAWSVPPVAASVLFYWLFNPGRRPGRLDPEPDAALAGRQHQLVRLQLDDQRPAAGLHGARLAGGLAGVPVHRGRGAGRPEDGPGASCTRPPGWTGPARSPSSGRSPIRC